MRCCDKRLEEEQGMSEEQPPTKPIHLDIKLRLLHVIPEESEHVIFPGEKSSSALAELLSDRLKAACHGDMNDEEQVICVRSSSFALRETNISNTQVQKELDRRVIARFPKNTVQTTSNLLQSLDRQLDLCAIIEDISLWEELPFWILPPYKPPIRQPCHFTFATSCGMIN